jgi:hypothetical protein
LPSALNFVAVWVAICQGDLAAIKIMNRIATIEKPHGIWSGSETIRFIAEDPEGLTSADVAIFYSLFFYFI